MGTTEQTTRTITLTIELDKDATMEEYARVLVAVGQIPGVESISGDPAIDFGGQS